MFDYHRVTEFKSTEEIRKAPISSTLGWPMAWTRRALADFGPLCTGAVDAPSCFSVAISLWAWVKPEFPKTEQKWT